MPMPPAITPPPALAAAETIPPRTVVLLHGLASFPFALRPIERAARARGWRVLNVGYPSREASIEAHAAHVVARLDAEAPAGPLFFVTHSMGGIVLRQAVASGALPAARVARAVMLAPPNGGSEVADTVAATWGLRQVGRIVLGPALAQLRTAPGSFVAALPPVPFETAVIAGTRSLNPLSSMLIPGPDDGRVAVARAGVPGMRAFLAVPHSHTFMVRSPRVVALALAFLERGALAGAAPAASAPSSPPGALPDRSACPLHPPSAPASPAASTSCGRAPTP